MTLCLILTKMVVFPLADPSTRHFTRLTNNQVAPFNSKPTNLRAFPPSAATASYLPFPTLPYRPSPSLAAALPGVQLAGSLHSFTPFSRRHHHSLTLFTLLRHSSCSPPVLVVLQFVLHQQYFHQEVSRPSTLAVALPPWRRVVPCHVIMTSPLDASNTRVIIKLTVHWHFNFPSIDLTYNRSMKCYTSFKFYIYGRHASFKFCITLPPKKLF